MPLKKCTGHFHNALGRLSISLVLACTQLATAAQGSVITTDHRATYDEKKATLEALWDKRVEWYPATVTGKAYDEIQLSLADTAFIKGAPFLDTLSFYFVQLYDVYALQPAGGHPDSIRAAFFHNADSTRPAYMVTYSLKQIRKRRLSGTTLCMALAFFSNEQAVSFLQPGQIVISLTKRDTFQRRFETWYHAWISQMAGIMGKYFIAHDRKHKRLLIIWEDASGVDLHSFSEPQTEGFRNFARYQ